MFKNVRHIYYSKERIEIIGNYIIFHKSKKIIEIDNSEINKYIK